MKIFENDLRAYLWYLEFFQIVLYKADILLDILGFFFFFSCSSNESETFFSAIVLNLRA